MTVTKLKDTIHPITDAALGNASYLVDVGGGEAVLVDPRRDVDEYLALAARLELTIVGVLETHLHADFVSGARETGAPIYAAADAGVTFPHNPVAPGDTLTFGSTTFDVISTPGHTPEHISFLMSRDGAQAVFSGGSLIVGGAARTDLTGAERTDELARKQFASLRTLAALPGDTLLLPTHGAGSFCSTGPARTATSTIATELETNPLMRLLADEEAFVRTLVDGYGSYPRYFANMRALNQHGTTPLAALEVDTIAPADAAAAVERGAMLIDGRSARRWPERHAAGSVSIPVGSSFASWLGWVVPFGTQIVLMVDPDQVEEAVGLAHRIGYDDIAGWLTFEAWRDAGLPTGSVDAVTAQDASERSASGTMVLDVRQRSENEVSRIPGSVHIELGDIIAGKTPDAAEVITYCGGGDRSATAASLLAARGVVAHNLIGGITAWRRAGFPLET